MARGGAIRKGLTIGLAAGVGAALVRASRARRSATATGAQPTWPPLPATLAQPPSAATGPPPDAGLVTNGTEALVAEAAALEAAGITEAAEVDEEAAAALRAGTAQPQEDWTESFLASPAHWADDAEPSGSTEAPSQYDDGGPDDGLGSETGWLAPDELVGADVEESGGVWAPVATDGIAVPADVDLEAIVLDEEAALEAERLEAERLELARLASARARADEEDGGRSSRERERQEALARFAAQQEEARRLLTLQEEREARVGAEPDEGGPRRPMMAGDLDDDLDEAAIETVGGPLWELESADELEPEAHLLDEDGLAVPVLEPAVPDDAVADLEEEPAWGVAVGTPLEVDAGRADTVPGVGEYEPVREPLSDDLAEEPAELFVEEVDDDADAPDDFLDDEADVEPMSEPWVPWVPAEAAAAAGGDAVDLAVEPEPADVLQPVAHLDLDDDVDDEVDLAPVGAADVEDAGPDVDRDWALWTSVADEDEDEDEDIDLGPLQVVGTGIVENDLRREPAARGGLDEDEEDEDDLAPAGPVEPAVLEDEDEGEEDEDEDELVAASTGPSAAPRRRPLMMVDFDDVLPDDVIDEADEAAAVAPRRRSGAPRVPLRARRDEPAGVPPPPAAPPPPVPAPPPEAPAARKAPVKKAPAAPKLPGKPAPAGKPAKRAPLPRKAPPVTRATTVKKAAATKAPAAKQAPTAAKAPVPDAPAVKKAAVKKAPAVTKAPVRKAPALKKTSTVTKAQPAKKAATVKKPGPGQKAAGPRKAPAAKDAPPAKSSPTAKAAPAVKAAPAAKKASSATTPARKVPVASTRGKQPRPSARATEGAPDEPASPTPAGETPAKAADRMWVEPTGDTCPPSHPVKASVSRGIFHVVGGLFYDRSQPERCYRVAAAAEADGLRPAKR